jgi:2,3-bisphosphoglycerate-independent phosphoglycerate mutase
MLAILDGWGIGSGSYGNAVMAARTPCLDSLFASHPHSSLLTSGLAVGLPEGQMGNSEVGHLNIGAGRTVYQSLTRVSQSISDGSFFYNSVLRGAMQNALLPGRSLHLMGLVGPGGVHSHGSHLLALLELAKTHGLTQVYVHAWLDGRDTPPRSALGYVEKLEAAISSLGTGKIVTVAGRYYAMDRDNRWERVEKAYDAVTSGTRLRACSAAEGIGAAYERGENDEFVLPTCITPDGADAATICDGDSVIFFNFRPDRARELTRALTEPDFGTESNAGFTRKRFPKELFFVTLMEYDATLKHVHVAFPPENIRNTLGEYISGLGMTQLRIAETEKYAHVTFFFNGQVEPPYPGEERTLIPSPEVATYDLMPEMSAYQVTESVIAAIDSGRFDLIVLNFANMDMVGHTGIMEAAIKAVETVDSCVGKIVKKILDAGGQILITADHGNSECMLTEDGEPVTAHSSNPVPLLLVQEGDDKLGLREGGALSDLAPTLLDMMGIPTPPEMTGRSLLVRY